MKTRQRIEDEYVRSYRRVPLHVGIGMALFGFVLTIFALAIFCTFIFIIVSGTIDLIKLMV